MKRLSRLGVRAGYWCSIAALLVFCGSSNLQNAIAQGETRTISFHHIHTDEELTVTYKVNGRYDEEALKKINNLMRDWRESKSITVDPHLIDLLWEVHREVGAKEAIWIVCGYRSPETNSMLRRRSSGVAQFSQHMLGKAIDFYIPGVPLEQLREAGLRAQRGGVGFYPTSGAPFVHMDTGSVRHWPRMPEPQLASVLAKGQLQSASEPTQRSRMPGLLAKLFGGGKDQAEDAAAAAAPAKAVATPRKPAEKPPVLAAAADSRSEKVAFVPVPPAKPAKPIEQVAFAAKPAQSGQLAASEPVPISASYELGAATSKAVGALQPASLIARASLSATSISATTSLPTTAAGCGRDCRAPTQRTRAVSTRRARPWLQRPGGPLQSGRGSVAISRSQRRRGDPECAACAAQPHSNRSRLRAPMGLATARRRLPPRKPPSPSSSDDPPSIAPPRAKAVSVVRVGDQFNEPWMRAMIVSPSAQDFMKTTVYGMADFRALGPYLYKPASIMMATFSEDPHRGMTSETFSGSAVGFTRTVTFAPPRTASLR
jgi:uncharacterized protein YcbK (DUF882 family)